MKTHLKKRSIALLSVLAMLISAMYYAPAALAADCYESESNNTLATADVTYDDYNNYGAISSTSDVDWWKITPTTSGNMNVWLGNIPSGCDYSLYLTDSSGAIRAYSVNSLNTVESMRIRVYASTTYYFKITSASGSSSSQYKLRFKIYNLKSGRIFTSQSSGQDYRPAATNSLPYIWQMGYGAQEFLHNTAKNAYDTIPSCDIFVARGLGNEGYSAFYHANATASYIYGYNPNSGTYDASIAAASAGAFQDVSLVIYCGSYTGKYSSTYQNLVQNTRDKSARCAIGWYGSTYTVGGNKWIEQFFKNCSYGQSVRDAAINATTWIGNYYTGSDAYIHLAMADYFIAGNAAGIIIG